MADFLSRLVRASRWGTALAVGAGCGGNVESSALTDPATDAAPHLDAADEAEAGLDGSPLPGTEGDAGLDVEITDAPAFLPDTPYPEPTGCFGPEFDSGLYGRCCMSVACTEPVGGACLDAGEVGYFNLPGFPPGSGTCTCGAQPVQGPFGPRNASEGACCYVFGVIGCEGRPLVVEGDLRLAPLVARSDWGTRPH